MIPVFGSRPGQPVNWFSRNRAASNQYCLYCGVCVGAAPSVDSNKEHLIGRSFVPDGYLNGDSFNLIFRACKRCNDRKSVAERHISSVSLFCSPARLEDPAVNELADRKASRDYHIAKKGVPVSAASEQRTIESRSGNFFESFSLSAPPQVVDEEVYLLACNHIQGLFAMLSTRDPRIREKSVVLPWDRVRYLGYFSHGDWAHPHLTEVTKRTEAWDCYAVIVAARGYFKVILRRAKEDDCWFWALEWNRYIRVVGAICQPDAHLSLFEDLPNPGWVLLPNGRGRIRAQAPLNEDADTLFLVTDFEDSQGEHA